MLQNCVTYVPAPSKHICIQLYGIANHFNNSNVYSHHWQTDPLSSFWNVLCFAVFTWHTLTCDSISTSSWPEQITIRTLNFVVSATAGSTTGTGFLDLQVGWLAVIPDCSTKRLAVWFLGCLLSWCSEGVLAVSDLSNSLIRYLLTNTPHACGCSPLWRHWCFIRRLWNKCVI